jgi:hypothetical protein
MDVDDESGRFTASRWRPAAAPTRAPREKPADADRVTDWREGRTPQGRVYYFNMTTEETAYERPKGGCFLFLFSL